MKKLNIFFVIITVFFGCKKYPDDTKRIQYGRYGRICLNWDVEYFSVNGVDSTVALRTWPNYGPYYFNGEEDTHGNTVFLYGAGGHGVWMWLNNKKTIYIL